MTDIYEKIKIYFLLIKTPILVEDIGRGFFDDNFDIFDSLRLESVLKFITIPGDKKIAKNILKLKTERVFLEKYSQLYEDINDEQKSILASLLIRSNIKFDLNDKNIVDLLSKGYISIKNDDIELTEKIFDDFLFYEDNTN